MDKSNAATERPVLGYFENSELPLTAPCISVSDMSAFEERTLSIIAPLPPVSPWYASGVISIRPFCREIRLRKAKQVQNPGIEGKVDRDPVVDIRRSPGRRESSGR